MFFDGEDTFIHANSKQFPHPLMTPDDNNTPNDPEDEEAKEDEQSDEEEPSDENEEEDKELPEPEEDETQEDDTESTDEDELDSESRIKTEQDHIPSGLGQISQSLTALNNLESIINDQLLEALEAMQASIFTPELLEALQQPVIDPETVATLQEPVVDPEIFQELTEFPALQEPFLDPELLEILESLGDTPLPAIYETVAALDQIERQTRERREPPEPDTDESHPETEPIGVFEIFYNAVGVYLSARSEYLPQETRPHIQNILDSGQVQDQKKAFKEAVITVKDSTGATVLILVDAVRFGFQMLMMTLHGPVIKEMIEEQREEEEDDDDAEEGSEDSNGDGNNGDGDEDGDDDDN